MVLGCPQEYVKEVVFMVVLFVMLKTKTQKSPPNSPPFDPLSEKLKIISFIYMAEMKYFLHWIGYR